MADELDACTPDSPADATERLDGATTVMEPTPSAGDTGEFLAILSQGSQPAPIAPGASGGAIPAVAGDEEAKPIVIKGGPRRVVRADGRAPEMSMALGQRRFALSSGHALFAPKKVRHPLVAAVGILVCAALVAAGLFSAWRYEQAQILHDRQLAMVDTSSFDGALSVTPANDGGYYTVFFVTSTPTDQDQVGELSSVVMFRANKDATEGAVRVSVPRDLAVSYTVYDASGNPTTQTRSLASTLEVTQSLTRGLQGICDGFGLRLYNMVCCDQATFDALDAILTGAAPTSSVDPESLLGIVRSNLSLEGIVEYCGKIGALDQGGVRPMNAPTTPVEANGVILARGSAPAYATSLNATLNGIQLDEHGYYVGTAYDEAGNPLLDDYGYPQGSLRDENGNLIFENGYLQFWGQQYDDRGNPVGTPYDDAGNPIFDWNGNPWGTQYGDDGNPLRDWRGNMVIYN